jgi:hypothetical protein
MGVCHLPASSSFFGLSGMRSARRTSRAKAVISTVLCGTAEPVPFVQSTFPILLRSARWLQLLREGLRTAFCMGSRTTTL